MATYAIGDIQGCYDELMLLLEKINFDENNDHLWFVGDLVNRGAGSLKVLRFIKQLGEDHSVVLGNHDLHLLCVFFNIHPILPNDTFQDVLNAADCEELLTWLRCRKFLHYEKNLNTLMVHAGLPPQWDLQCSLDRAKEIEALFKSDHYKDFFKVMYGDTPNLWRDDLKSWDRCRFIINAFTRIRYCDDQGRLNFSEKGSVLEKPSHLFPWFQAPHRQSGNIDIVFGHWAALCGDTQTPHVFALDTGCSWGRELTAMCLENHRRFSVTKL